jgi:NDP-sugar pyrophosphorylase family protein
VADVRTAVVLAGGLGTRISSVTQGRLPKVLVPVAGRPFLDHKIDEMHRLGVDRVLLLLGSHGDQVAEHVRSRAWPLQIDHRSDGETLRGTGGAIKYAAGALDDEFWVTYGDTLLDADLAGAERFAAERGLAAVMTVLRNDDRWEPSNVRLDGDLVISYRKGAPPGSHQYLDYGYLLLPKAAFLAQDAPSFDLAVVIQSLVTEGRLGGFPVTERFHDIGTAEALADTEAWLSSPHRVSS